LSAQADLTRLRRLIICASVALLAIAVVDCSPASVANSPATAALTPSVPSTVGPAPAPVDPTGPDGAVERAYQAFERGDVNAFLDGIDPAVRDRPGPLEFGNLVILDATGLNREVSKTSFTDMRYSVLATDGKWAKVAVQGVVRSAALGEERSIAGVEIARHVQGRWVLSTALAARAAEEGARAAGATPPGADPPYWRVVGNDGANLRGAPSRTASIMRDLPKAEVVTNLDQEATADGLTWRRVAYGTIERWVAAELLAPQWD
jgi:hypothetical protein